MIININKITNIGPVIGNTKWSTLLHLKKKRYKCRIKLIKCLNYPVTKYLALSYNQSFLN